MAKRAAGDQLTSDNWERDSDEKEDGGIFQRASEEEIKNRPIKKAKRTMLRTSETPAQGGLFAGIKLQSTIAPVSSSVGSAGFSFGKAATSVSANSVFGKTPLFPASTNHGSGTGVSLGFGGNSPSVKNVASSFGNTAPGSTGLVIKSVSSGVGGALTGETDLDAKKTSSVVKSSGTRSKESKFLSELRLLNTSVSKWISRHLQENPYVDLSPVFQDYFEHLRKISKEDETSPPTSNTHNQITLPLPNPSTNQVPTFNSLAGGTTVKPLSSDEPTSQEDGEEEEDASEHPSGEEDSCSPQEEGESRKDASSVPNKDCLMSVRCKLFYKKESSFTDLGVGNLSVEERPSGVRLLLRNDTTLGKVLLNVHLKGEVPVTQQKNNVIIVCQPNPPLSEDTSEIVTYLIRVKDASLAEELHGTIKNRL